MKKKLALIFASAILVGGVNVAQAMEEPEKELETEVVSCPDEEEAAQQVAEMITRGSDPVAAMEEVLSKTACAMQSVLSAALQGADEDQHEKIIRSALAWGGPGSQGDVIAGATLVGVDATPYLQAPGAGAPSRSVPLPGYTNRGNDGGNASPS